MNLDQKRRYLELLRKKAQLSNSQPEPTWGQTAKNVGRQVGQGASFGFADEIEAGIRAPFSDKGYGEIQKNISSQNRAFEQEHPIGSTALQLGGGLATGLVGGAKVAGAKAIQAIPKLLRYGGGGATGGAVAGAGYGEEDKGKSALLGGVAGGVLGTASPMAMKAIKWSGKKFWDVIADRIKAPQTVGGRKVLEAMSRDDLTPDAAMAKLRELGEESTLADIGKNLTGLGETVASKPGRALSVVEQAFETRRGDQGNRLVSKLDEVLGTVNTGLKRRAEDVPEYAAALSRQVPIDKTWLPIMSRPSIKKAWAKAQEFAAEEGATLPGHGEFLDALRRGEITAVQTRPLDWLKRSLDDRLETARDEITGRLTKDIGSAEMRLIDSTRAQLRTRIKQANPDYKVVLEEASGEFGIKNARKKGMDALRRRPAEIEIQLGSMRSETERQNFRAGMIDSFKLQISPKSEMGQDASGVIRRNRDRIIAAFGSEKGERILRTARQEGDFARTENRILSGSPTARRLAGQSDLDVDPSTTAGVASDLAGGRPFAALGRAGIQSLRSLQRAGIPESARTEIAELLFTSGPDALPRIAAAIKRSTKGMGEGRARALAASLLTAQSGQVGRLAAQ